MLVLSHINRKTIRCRLPYVAQAIRQFNLPPNYKPNTAIVDDLPFAKSFEIWYNSFQPNRLRTLQDELVKLMLSPEYVENTGLKHKNLKVPIDGEGNYINELQFEIVNNSDLPTKHIVFIHGYGASLGCFARNFQLINKLRDLKHNYTIHFLDNISFGLSSNPKIKDESGMDSIKITSAPKIRLNDNKPTDPKKLHNKYYKLIDSYELDIEEFKKYQDNFKPILEKIENYYLSAIENWRINSKIDQIDFLVGHSYGGYWSASYALKHQENLKDLILLSPVGVERHVHSIKNPLNLDIIKKLDNGLTQFRPTLDPSSNNFLSRWPILSNDHINKWYKWQALLPRFLKFFGPFGVDMYYKMWYLKLFKINKLIHKKGGAKRVFKNSNDLIYGTNKECLLIIEYLYNSITSWTKSDYYIKYLLTPSTVSKWPLFDKFTDEETRLKKLDNPMNIHFLYGQYDFMNAEAGAKLSDQINQLQDQQISKLHKVSEGGHNLYIDNPFEVNQLIHDIIKEID
ncbi:alpha/beta-hydrolase [Hyphopichia burtonii NRRL Y-1933]|uniref:Alpha/beta-hydrolase n=1 Tax=Hyphopichia burtonii NRRL Y-1933 TaxID=984485 RepID=A0A1E4RN99_9ASCO|nr:alpha/beta-hydrolase [Hyphopichia burtonii NRRL Y-1933]ODV68729.1 alpha/beta-hydrolase [Hyphopichia burtonii NRRL Y-1933]